MFTCLTSQLLIIHSLKTIKFRSIIFTYVSPCLKKKKNFCKLLLICLVFLVYQMRPSYHPEGLFDENKVAANPIERSSPVKQLWHQNGKCPEGTIPVRRTKEDDILRASSIKRYGRKKRRTAPQPRSADPDLINQSGHQVIKVVTFFFFLK